LVSQLRRAAISVCSKLQKARPEDRSWKKRFYEISRSSVVEIGTQLEIASLLEYLKAISINEVEQKLESVFRILSKMIGNLESK
jgi:four helix bundle protein